MNKVQIAYRRLTEILPGDERAWTLKLLLREVNWALDLEEMVSLSTLRKAVALLPEGCVNKADRAGQGKTLTIASRHFARRNEVIAALRALPHWSDDLPVLIERHKPTLQTTLLLANGSALYHSLEWASSGAYEIDYTVYGTMVRWTGKRKGVKAA